MEERGKLPRKSRPGHRRGPYRRRHARGDQVQGGRAVAMVAGPDEDLAVRTARLIAAASEAGVSGLDAVRAVVCAVLGSTADAASAADLAALLAEESGLVARPAVAETYRRAGAGAWQRFRKQRELAVERLLAEMNRGGASRRLH